MYDLHEIYQTQNTVFNHISKHREESWKYDAQQSIFDKLQGVWKCGQTRSWVFDTLYTCIFSIEAKTKEKTEKSNHKNLC